jgi:hypothetical protein
MCLSHVCTRLKVRTRPHTSKLRCGGESLGFAAFVLVKEADKLSAVRLFLRGDLK